MLKREMFERKVPIDLHKLPRFEVRGSRIFQKLPPENISEVEGEFRNDPRYKGFPHEYLGLLVSQNVKLGTKGEDLEFASGLRKATHESIDGLLRFLDSPYITKPDMEFLAPTTEAEVAYGSRRPVAVYFVPEYSRVHNHLFKIQKDGKRTVVGVRIEDWPEGSAGRRAEIINDNDGLKTIWQADTPIFIKTAGEPEYLVEIPPAEILHHAVRRYTYGHTNHAIKAQKAVSLTEAYKIGVDFVEMEEQLVHALSSLWMKEVTGRTGILSGIELERRIAAYELLPMYRGVIPLIEHIEQIGVQKAIEMYVNDARGLMRDARVQIK